MPPMSDSESGLTMREMSARSGVSEATLRMWELRHGFPTPQRRSSGHRRYAERDLARVRAVLRARESGLSLQAAIALASGQEEEQA
ncbi:MAG: MerR family transcriptional regulator, partial [Solirubrobacterales bacterium]|nr:MerR family transcriptional regulator [Solirubrobacterales bacterium]